ncbi:MAG: Peroxisomal membrane signal receptor PTS1 [Stictis urceolatum]|nr:Peroxisomal membrane signal receptor PTS1 [Stictis urceolata]
MSFLGGPECSTAGNPLTQFTKHVQNDKSLQRDRMVGRGPGGRFEGMRTQRPMGQNDKMMDDFLQQQPGMPAQPLAMEQMRRDLPNYAQQTPRSGSPGWAADFDPGEQARMENAFQGTKGGMAPGFNTREFQRFQDNRSTSMSPIQSGPAMMSGVNGGMNGYQSNYMGGMGMGMNGMGMMGGGMNGMYRPQMGMQQPMEPQLEGKGKGRMVELDDTNWEEQFAEIDAAGQEHDIDAEANAAMERELNDIDRSVAETLDGDFESVWRGLQAERGDRGIHDSPDFDIGGHMGDMDPWEHFDTIGTHSNMRDPQLGEYQFEEDNVFKQVDNPFEEGMKIMQEAGNLSLAALAFEAAVQKEPSHVEAWNMLGAAQAQNEKETPAIRSLEQALRIDENNLEALMGLAVSYTNEGYDATAYRTLERWLSVKYPAIISPDSLSTAADVGFTDRHLLHEKVTNLFIKAAQLSPDGEHMDPDVQVGLGVLFYGDEEYEKAVDCFSAALASTESGTTNQRAQVHLLWNRLGATLANSGRPEEAIAAYERALTMNPNFVRARYNLGVSCINIGVLEQAAQHLLGALSMHAVVQREGRERVQEVLGMGGGGDGVSERELERMMSANTSSNLYETLRRVFSQMERRDLAERVVVGMDVDQFRGEFDF